MYLSYSPYIVILALSYAPCHTRLWSLYSLTVNPRAWTSPTSRTTHRFSLGGNSPLSPVTSSTRRHTADYISKESTNRNPITINILSLEGARVSGWFIVSGIPGGHGDGDILRRSLREILGDQGQTGPWVCTDTDWQMDLSQSVAWVLLKLLIRHGKDWETLALLVLM